MTESKTSLNQTSQKGNVPPDEPVSDGDESRELEEPDESNGQIACAWLIKMDPIISFKLTFIVGRKAKTDDLLRNNKKDLLWKCICLLGLVYIRVQVYDGLLVYPTLV